MSVTRRRLAKRIEEAFLSQFDIELTCDPAAISFATGFYRTNTHSDSYRWSAICKLKDMNVGPSVDSYDTATKCGAMGITLDKYRQANTYEATAREEKI